MLLQAFERVKIALRGVARSTSLGQLGIEREHFFARSAAGEIGLIGLRGLHLRLRAGSLAAQIGVVKLQQQLPFANVLAFFHQQAFNSCWDGRVRLKILDGLNFSIGGDQAANRPALHRRGADAQRALARENWDESDQGNGADREPRAPLSVRNTSVRIVVGCQPVIFSGCGRDYCKP